VASVLSSSSSRPSLEEYLVAQSGDPWAAALDDVFGEDDSEAETDDEPIIEAGDLRYPTVSLASFVEGGWHVLEPDTPFVSGWHVDAIALHLEAVTRHAQPKTMGPYQDPKSLAWALAAALQDLIVNVPPGHMKSLLVCVFWPAWVWTFWPGARFIFTSYDDELVIRDSVKCRNLLESDWYRETFAPDWQMSSDQNVKGYFRNTRMGERLARTVGGGSTGHRGNIVVVDDPLNVLHRYIEERREKAADWWFKGMSTRLNNKQRDCRVIIMQRLHHDDLAGKQLRRGGYDHLCLPTEYIPERQSRTSIGWKDPRQKRGELLFPGMFPESVVEEIKTDLGSADYEAQHQQNPSVADGGIFQRTWWKFYEKMPPVIQQIVLSLDCTFKDTKGTDFVVFGVWGRLKADLYLLDQIRARLSFVNTLAGMKAVCIAWPRMSMKLVEDKANGTAVIDTLKREIPGLIPIDPDGGKITRAHAASPIIEAGNVFLPGVGLALERARYWRKIAEVSGSWLDPRYVSTRTVRNDALGLDMAEWVHNYIEEHAAFPAGSHDDQVDQTTQVINRIYQPGRETKPLPKTTPSMVLAAIGGEY